MGLSDWYCFDVPAKVNLNLHVTEKRTDGYHLLDSLVVFTDGIDRIFVRKSDWTRVEIQGAFCDGISSEQNSIWGAINWFTSRYGIDPKVEVVLEKNIPVEAGLGGGSSDCAVMLRALCGIFEKPVPDAIDLLDLGADVPACFWGRSLQMRGIGELLTEVKCEKDYGILLMNPGVAVQTGKIFSSPLMCFSSAPNQMQFEHAVMNGHNDLEAAAIDYCPQIRDRIDALNEQKPMVARMSGSGASVFGLFDNQAAAFTAKARLRKVYAKDWIWAGGLTRDDSQPDHKAQ